jgi:hypothetical protein
MDNPTPAQVAELEKANKLAEEGRHDAAVLEMFKGRQIFHPSIMADPEKTLKAWHKFKSCIFKDDGSRNALSPQELQKWKGNPHVEMMQKAWTQPTTATSGIAQYDLEQGAKLLYPITTLFRNMIPRVTGGTGIQSNYRKITAVNPNRINIGLAEGKRGPAMQQTEVDAVAPFKTSGLDNFVTEQAYLSAVTFEDLYSLAATTTLQGTMEGEELLTIGANSSIALGTTPTPTGTPVASGGFLADASTYSLIAVALTYLGMETSTFPTVNTASSNAKTGGAIALPYTRANLDGTTDLIQGFSGAQSAASAAINVTGGGGLGSITAKVAAVNGAIGYAWYLGSTAGTERLVAITGYPAVTITALNSTGQLATAAPTTDVSTNALNYDGILTQILTPGSGAYVQDLAGAPFTTAGAGSGQVTEINNALYSFYNNFRLVPTDIFMNIVDQVAVAAIVLNGNTNMAPFFMGGSSEGGLQASTVLKRYVNPIGFGNPFLEVHTHPFIPPGTVMFYSRTNPYPLSNVPNLLRMLLRRDYWQVDWPVVTMQKTLGVYFDGTLQMYFAPAFGVIKGIKSAGSQVW